MIIKRLAVGPIDTNCYIVGDEITHQGAVIDPGGNADKILSAVKELKLQIKYVINTHAHWDHIYANSGVLSETGAQLALHRNDLPLLNEGGGGAMFGLPKASSPSVDLYLDEGDKIDLGELTLDILLTPGHTPGSISLYSADAGVLFSGDFLFNQGVGRTDLPGGDYEVIMESLDRIIHLLPDETIVYPGHGPETTIGDEKQSNPFL